MRSRTFYARGNTILIPYPWGIRNGRRHRASPGSSWTGLCEFLDDAPLVE